MSRSIRVVSVSALALVSLLLVGCSKALAPTFQAVAVREISHDQDRSLVEFTIRATNPNNDPIPLKRVSYQIEIDGKTVFEGVRSPETTLHNYASHEFVLPAVLPEGALTGSGSVEYGLVGSVSYIPPGRLAEVLFDAEVKVPEAMLDIRGTIETGR